MIQPPLSAGKTERGLAAHIHARKTIRRIEDAATGARSSEGLAVELDALRSLATRYSSAARRKNLLTDAWSRGLTTIRSMFTCSGLVTAQAMQSATSPGVSGVIPS
jgi:hypothetical protein